MNASKVKLLCGGRVSKTGKGPKGMTTKDIEKFVREKLPTMPQNVQGEFKRLQKKDRLSLCMILSKFKNGQELLQQAKTPPKKVTKKTNDPFEEAARASKLSPTKKSPTKTIGNNSRLNFRVTNENGESNGNGNSPNKEGKGYAGNSPNAETKRKIVGQRNWAAIRRAEPDPIGKKVKIRGQLKGQINARLRRLKRTGKLPEGKTMAEILKNELTRKPKNFKKGGSPPKRTPKPVVKFMNLGKLKSESTSRRNYGQSVPAIFKTKGYSATQIRDARLKADAALSSFNKAGLLPNANNKTFLTEMSNLKKELLNGQLSSIVPSGSSPTKANNRFNLVSGKLNLNAELKRINKLKAKNKTPSIRRKERIFRTLKKMRPSKPAIMKTSKLVPMMNNGSPANNSPSPEKIQVGLNTSVKSIERLKNKKNRGEKLSSPERKLLNVVNALRK